MDTALKCLVEPSTLAGVRRYAVNSAWILAEQLLRLVAGLLVGTWVARHLGPTDYGALSYFFSYVSLFAALARMGMDTLAVRLLITDPARDKVILGTVFRIKLLGSAMALVLVALSAPYAAKTPSEAFYITVIASGLLFQSFDAIDFWFHARTNTRIPSTCRLIQLAVSSIAKIAMILSGEGLPAFVAVAVIDQVLLAWFLWIAFRRTRDPGFAREFDHRLAFATLDKASPLIVAGILVSLYSRLDQVILRHIADADSVGWYAAAIVVSEALYALPIAISTALFPAIVASHRDNRNLYAYRIGLLGRTLVLSGIVVSSVMSAAAVPIVRLLYGESYLPSAQVLSIHVWILPLICYSAVLGKILITEGRQHILPRLTAVAMISHALGLFVLVPGLGLKGAAIAALLAQAIPVIILLVADRSTRKSFVFMIAGRKISGDGVS